MKLLVGSSDQEANEATSERWDIRKFIDQLARAQNGVSVGSPYTAGKKYSMRKDASPVVLGELREALTRGKTDLLQLECSYGGIINRLRLLVYLKKKNRQI